MKNERFFELMGPKSVSFPKEREGERDREIYGPHKRYGSTAAANSLEISSGSAFLLERCVELRKYRLPARDTLEQCSVCGHVGGSGAERLA